MSEITTKSEEKIRGYANPEAVVTTDWLAQHLDDTDVRIVEADEDVLLYEVGHIPGAVKLDWHSDLQNPITRDFVDRAGFEALMRQKGIGTESYDGSWTEWGNLVGAPIDK